MATLPSMRDSKEYTELTRLREGFEQARPQLERQRAAAAERVATLRALVEKLDLDVLTGEARAKDLTQAREALAQAERALADLDAALALNERRREHLTTKFQERERDMRRRISPELRAIYVPAVKEFYAALVEAKTKWQALAELTDHARRELCDDRDLVPPEFGDLAALAGGTFAWDSVLGTRQFQGPNQSLLARWTGLAAQVGVEL